MDKEKLIAKIDEYIKDVMGADIFNEDEKRGMVSAAGTIKLMILATK